MDTAQPVIMISRGFRMRKTIAAAAVGLLLVAGQTAAASASGSVRIGDRVGARAGASSDLTAAPLPVLLIGTAALIGVVVVVSDDDDDSESN